MEDKDIEIIFLEKEAKEKIKDRVIIQLDYDYEKQNEKIIDDFIDDYLNIASDNSHRKRTDEKLIPYVKNAVIQAYNRLGDEGNISLSEGSQNYTFVDIEEKLKKDVRSIRILS